jgi:hypothetical protein
MPSDIIICFDACAILLSSECLNKFLTSIRAVDQEKNIDVDGHDMISNGPKGNFNMSFYLCYRRMGSQLIAAKTSSKDISRTSFMG